MKIFDGIYSWDGKKHDDREPVAWFPGAYNLSIYDLGSSNEGVTLLKPYLCIFSETGRGHSVSANPGKFAKNVSADFALDIERVLWVEKLTNGQDRFDVVIFSRNGRLGDEHFYHAERRPPTEAEERLINIQITALSH